MRPKLYRLVSEAIDEGVAFGVRRFFKHRDLEHLSDAHREELAEDIAAEVMNALCERFDFPSDEA